MFHLSSSHNLFAFSSSIPLPSFAFPEDQVQASADQGGGEADPSQDEGGAVGAILEAHRVEAVLLIRVDGGCDHHAQGCGKVVGRSLDFFIIIHVCHKMAVLDRTRTSTKIIHANC